MQNVSSISPEILLNDGEFVLSRREGRKGAPSALILSLAQAQPSKASLERMENAFSLRKFLDPSWAARPVALERDLGLPKLVMEDPGGVPLSSLMGVPWELHSFLKVAVGLAASLSRLHDHRLVHRNMTPANVLVDVETGAVWLTGFGLASRLPRERKGAEPPGVITGTFAYMAPEQTGRMNRSVDCRSDLYSCGVMLYEMLTGAPPFSASSPIEWVHCHVARKPAPVGGRGGLVPEAVNAIVQKLLSKNPEDRYQSAAGLGADLGRCLSQWEAGATVSSFALGTQDASDQLLLPEQLYGRDAELRILVEAGNRLAAGGGAELVLVSGYPGIGKSSLVMEWHKALTPLRTLFGIGKCDQSRRDVPYASVAQSFRGLVRGLLALGDAELNGWRASIQEAVGTNGQVIVDIVPELSHIIGSQPPLPALAPRDAQQRLFAVFRRFLNVFARQDHPLALFLDDMQWVDAATLDLVEHLVLHPEVRHLLIIGAYRDNEVGPTHPLTRKLDALRGGGLPLLKVELGPLGLPDTWQLVTDALRCEPGRATALAELLKEKTDGNPFFMAQFLTDMSEQRLISFDPSSATWIWDAKQIGAQASTNNVGDFMAGRLGRLPSAALEALKRFSCLGSTAEVDALRIAAGLTPGDGDDVFWECVRSGLVLRQDGGYAFAHDRIQEAAYALIPEGERAAIHLGIGRALLARTRPEGLEEAVFEVVNQLNRGARLIESPAERRELAALNLLAGKRSKAATAYVSALKYLAAGESLLETEPWGDNAPLNFALAIHRAECELLTGDLDAAEERLAMLAQRDGNSTVERAAVACLRVLLYLTLARRGTAIAEGVGFLKSIGMEWPSRPTHEDVRREYDHLLKQLGDRSIGSLLGMPLVPDADRRATMEVLSQMLAPVIGTDAILRDMVLLRMANLSVAHGHSDASTAAYVMLNMVLGPRFGNYKAGAEFGQLGLDLMEQRGLSGFKARVYCCYGCMVVPWARPLREGRSYLVNGLEVATASGDFTYCLYSHLNLTSHLLACGDPLEGIQREAERGVAFSKKAGFITGIHLMAGHVLLVRALRGLPAALSDGEPFDQGHYDQQIAGGTPDKTMPGPWYWIRRLQTHFYMGDYASAALAASKAEADLWVLSGFLEEAEFHFYAALARAARVAEATPEERPRLLKAVVDHHQQLVAWRKDSPGTFSDRAALVGAEIARLEGHELKAERLYEDALALSRENGFLHHEAVANELAGRFYRARGFATIGLAYLRNARSCFERWGALGKVRQLDRLHPELETDSPPNPAMTLGAPVENMELATVLKLSQTVSGEMVLDKMLHQLMVMTLEHSGADRGVLVMPEGHGTRVVAEATSSGGGIKVRLDGSIPSPLEIPDLVLKFVLRTREVVLIDDTAVRNPFSADEYVARTGARSVLCLPLVKQAELIGVLYLENGVASHAFTPGKVAVLKLLASQAAVSVENASLYTDLQQADAYLAKAQELSLTGSFGWKPSTGEITWSKETFRIFGLEGDVPPTLDGIFARVHPEDRASLREFIDRVSREPKGWTLEHRLLLPDGAVKHLKISAHATLGEPGGSLTFVGAVMDVTAVKQSRQALENALREIQSLKDRLQDENVALREEVDKTSMFEEIVGSSPRLCAVLSSLSKVAPTDSTVLITGETGTGKELVARAIHRRSARAARPFVSVNCAAVPPSLIASELFGHEKGAFTGATEKRTGRFELAEGGTLFLDEVGELPPETQLALLRVLQEREFERVGGSRPIRADVRLIAATNRNLEAAIGERSFRADLFYRLNVFPLEVPPLRNRRTDIPMLVEYFIDRFSKRSGKRIRGIEKSGLDLLNSYHWPGNIRELQNIVERAVILAERDTLSIDENWLSVQPSHSSAAVAVKVPDATTLAEREKRAIEAALAEAKGRVSGPHGAAMKLGIPPTTLESKIKALGLDKGRFKRP